MKAFHDASMNTWCLTVQLDKEWYYFLSVFIKENGSFEKYSLDYEGACDSHYYFKNETAIREKLYEAGDESKYLHEILIRYVEKNGTGGLVELLEESITEQFHFY